MTKYFGLLLFLTLPFRLSAEEPYAITVQSGPRQVFAGFGASQVSAEFGHFAPESQRGEMADLLYRDLKAKILRLWVDSSPDQTVAGMKARFYADYVDNGIISLLAARGVETLLLAPARGMEAPRDSLPGYAAKLAEFIHDIRKERGVSIHVTGIANEPEGWSGEQVAETVKFLRAELDARGLKGVGIIAPENPSANEVFDAQVAALRRDPKAWEALAGIASHSYNMAARDSEALENLDRTYWMTEASDDGNEQGLDEERAATTAGRFLNDLNHLVTHWIFFKGFSYSPDVRADDYTASRLMQYDAASDSVVVHLKYDYLKALLSVFDAGAVLRRCHRAPEADRAYTYGQKPKICAAAGLNPDGTWGLGVVNLTGISFDPGIAEWHPAETVEITIRIEELGETESRLFKVFRRKEGREFVEAGELEARRGRLALSLAPRELVCLRSKGGTE